MNAPTFDRDAFYQIMLEMVLLSTDDPRRREFETVVAHTDEWTQQEWMKLLAEDERLRLELLRVSPPPGFEARLLAIPDEMGKPGVPYYRARYVASVVGLILLLSAGAWYVWRWIGTTEKYQTLALLAMSDHIDEIHLAIKTNDVHELEKELSGQFPFPLHLPPLGSQFTLLGGRRCILGAQPVLYSRWKGPQGEYTLFQFRPEDFALEANLPKTLIKPQGPASSGHPCEVMIWTEKAGGYILVADHGEYLKPLLLD